MLLVRIRHTKLLVQVLDAGHIAIVHQDQGLETALATFQFAKGAFTLQLDGVLAAPVELIRAPGLKAWLQRLVGNPNGWSVPALSYAAGNPKAIKPLFSNDPELNALVEKSKARGPMTEAELKQQQASWVRGEMGLRD